MRHIGDALLLTGAALVVIGVWWIWPPAALIVGGVALAALGWRAS